MLQIFKRFTYLIYYIKQLDWAKFNKFLNYVATTYNKNKFGLILDIIVCVFKYNIGIMDYFIFRFFQMDKNGRNKWAGTGFMYEYHLKMNPNETRDILSDKIKFFTAYADFVNHTNCTISDLEESNAKMESVLNNKSGKIVIKDSLGQCGWDVEVLKTSELNKTELLKYMKQKGFNLIEEFVIQHPELAKLSTTGLNTVRMVTQFNKKNEVEILAARLRISVNSHVDNLASGNIAAPIDINSGKVSGLGVYSDITKQDVEFHPMSNLRIVDFQVPKWNEVKELVINAAKHRPENRSIGWDVAITENGVELIEGNHNWCKILWQLPVKKGLKDTLNQYL